MFFDINGIDDMTAYYGSPSPLICRFVQQHKPAMVSEEAVVENQIEICYNMRKLQ